MSTYAIGDVQGCFEQLRALISQLKFDRSHDCVWFTGDLVNRGPQSAEVVRFVKSLGDAAITVLGNHDLHLLAVAYGHQSEKKDDSLQSILQAPDRDELLDWIRTRPLLHYDADRLLTLIHAGLAPQWTLQQAIACAREVESELRSDNFNELLATMYGNEPDCWNPDMNKWERLRFTINCFTRLRYINGKGKLKLKVKGAPGSQPEGTVPWFQADDRQTTQDKFIFGHWSTLGFYLGDNVVGLDTGCLWGGRLTAVNIDQLISGNEVVPVSVPCVEQQKPVLKT